MSSCQYESIGIDNFSPRCGLAKKDTMEHIEYFEIFLGVLQVSYHTFMGEGSFSCPLKEIIYIIVNNSFYVWSDRDYISEPFSILFEGKNKRFEICLDPGQAMHKDSGYTKNMVR